MRKSKPALLAGALLTIFTLFSCQQPENPGTNTTGGGENGSAGSNTTYTVKFDDNGTIIKTLTVKAGATISTSSKPSNPSKDNNYFMYWSASKASLSTAVEFNFNTPINKDTTLYAIYSPKLAYSSIQNLISTQIEIKLNSTAVFPLEDGSYAGIKFERSTTDSNYTEYTISTAPTYRDENNYRFLTYTFPNRLPAGLNYIKVSNYRSYQYDSKSVRCFENPKTITFNNNGTVIKTVEVESGTTISSSVKPSNPSDSRNYFLHWSTSKASTTAAVAFDFNTPITENTTLYAIYAPKMVPISVDKIKSVTGSQIQISILYGGITLDDGSYAGVTFEHSSDNQNYTNLAINPIPVDVQDDSVGYKYLTYNFTTPLSTGTHYFRVTSGQDTGTKNIYLDSPAAVTNLNVTTADRYANVAFTTAAANYSYTVKAYKNDIEVASKSIPAESNNTTYNVEFFGLTNETIYTFKVFTDGSSLSAQATGTPALTQKTSDWLVLMYMDGDNDLHQSIYIDMNEAEYGLNYIRNSDGTAKTDYQSVNVVALWDGAVSWEDTDDDGNPVTVTPQIGESGSYIFELGADSGCDKNYVFDNGVTLSNKTKNLSYTADWLCSYVTESTNQKQYHGEVNMGSKQNLINFLNWAKAHYTAGHIILQFSNHGGGPRNATYVETEDGRIIKIGNDNERKALCWDDSSSSNFLKTKDVSEALTDTEFTGSNKLSIILMDVCLGSSLEDAYQFRNNADYLAASPNTIPGSGLDYIKLMRSFKTSNSTDLSIAKQMVTDYKGQYTANTSSTNYLRDRLWNSYAQQIYGTTYSNLKSEQKQALEWFSAYVGITTFTITDLSQIDDVKTAIDDMCNILLSTTGKDIYVDENGKASTTVTETTQKYVNYLSKQHADFLSASNINNTMTYMGSYTWLYDIGYFADMVKHVSRSTSANTWPELYSAANAVTTALDSAIKYSWHDSKLDSNDDFYHSIDSSTTEFVHHYGLTVAGYGIAFNAGYIVKGTVPNWYKTDLAFGADSKWGDLLAYWFNN